ncbi:MAG: hypothetical protein LBC74_11550 [Planctomycetaceae bacterium]|jgi:hypothetical protein|nr:hypothetical protein [Planctomycetaceae bacterium]
MANLFEVFVLLVGYSQALIESYLYSRLLIRLRFIVRATSKTNENSNNNDKK